MALLKRKKNTLTPSKTNSDSKAVPAKRSEAYSGSVAHTAVAQPRITEKSTLLSEKHVYTFNVSPRANKQEVSAFIRAKYNVVPTKVRVVTIAAQKTFVRGRRGMKAGGKKAYVYLRKGDTIDFV